LAILSKDSDDPILLLVEQIQKGIRREENSRLLFDIHRPRVFSYFARKGFSPEENQDLTQETFLRVFNAIDSFRRESRFEWWMFEIADSVYKNELRRRKANKRDGIEQSLDVPVSAEAPAGPGLVLAAGDPSPEEEAVRRERLARVRSALRDLPPQMRLCCVLRYERGLKYQEIATVMNISIETVKAHLHQARKKLIAMLGDGGGEGSS
jgi:RNA polymerase sigma-70 factor (ECF subfamily)